MWALRLRPTSASPYGTEACLHTVPKRKRATTNWRMRNTRKFIILAVAASADTGAAQSSALAVG